MGALRPLDPVALSAALCSGQAGSGHLDGGCAWVSLQEAEQELLARVQLMLGLVGRGYSVTLLLWGRKTEAPQLVPQVSPSGATGHRSHELKCCLLRDTFENIPSLP